MASWFGGLGDRGFFAWQRRSEWFRSSRCLFMRAQESCGFTNSGCFSSNLLIRMIVCVGQLDFLWSSSSFLQGNHSGFVFVKAAGDGFKLIKRHFERRIGLTRDPPKRHCHSILDSHVLKPSRAYSTLERPGCGCNSLFLRVVCHLFFTPTIPPFRLLVRNSSVPWYVDLFISVSVLCSHSIVLFVCIMCVCGVILASTEVLFQRTTIWQCFKFSLLVPSQVCSTLREITVFSRTHAVLVASRWRASIR